MMIHQASEHIARPALYYTAVINGTVAPPLLLMIMLIGNNRSIMKDKVNKKYSNAMGWITTAAMTLAAAALLQSILFDKN